LPWIVILLIFDTFSTMVVDKLQYQFNGYTILIAFIPVLMDTGGNAGGQTIAIIIRGLAMKEFEPKECWKVLRRESVSASSSPAASPCRLHLVHARTISRHRHQPGS
jgi:magnesium transporter